ncbi:hypothetical protein D3C78_1370710 [compost metagenome]
MHQAVHYDPFGTPQPAGFRQCSIGKYARRQHHTRGGKRAPVSKGDGVRGDVGHPCRQFAVNSALAQRLFQQRTCLRVKLLFHQQRSAMHDRDVVT